MASLTLGYFARSIAVAMMSPELWAAGTHAPSLQDYTARDNNEIGLSFGFCTAVVVRKRCSCSVMSIGLYVNASFSRSFLCVAGFYAASGE